MQSCDVNLLRRRKLNALCTCACLPQAQEKNQLQAVIQKLEVQQLSDAATPSGERSSAPASVQAASAVANSGRGGDVEVRQAHANLRELQERHALQVSSAFEQLAVGYMWLTDIHFAFLNADEQVEDE